MLSSMRELRSDRRLSRSVSPAKQTRQKVVKQKLPMDNLENQSTTLNRQSRKTSSEGRTASPKKRAGKRAHRNDSFNSSSSKSSTSSTNRKCKKEVEPEEDPTILDRRQKQLDYGKNSVAYDNYVSAVPKESRSYFMPRTPNKYVKYSRRQWDGLVKAWKLQIHAWNSQEDDKKTEFPSVEQWKDENADLPPSGSSTQKTPEKRAFQMNWCDEELSNDAENDEDLKRRKLTWE